jgi:hypothetical protein
MRLGRQPEYAVRARSAAAAAAAMDVAVAYDVVLAPAPLRAR